MKISTLFQKAFFSFCFIISISCAKAQYVAIPDSNFGKWLYNYGYASCITGNGSAGYLLDTTCSAVLAADTISPDASNIRDLTGIQYFKNLNYLDCWDNLLTTLPVLPPHLTTLFCFNNLLDTLTNLPATLTYLKCGSNQLNNLPALPAGLIYLDCDYNYLTSITNLPPNLQSLTCFENRLTTVTSLPSSLTYLYCSNNELTSLPLANTSLTWLNCSSNLLDSLPGLPGSLLHLDCEFNKFKTISGLPTSLTFLSCGYNSLLTGITASLPNLTDFSCVTSPLVYCLPDISNTANLNSFYISGTAITCLPARFTATSFDVNPASLPLCGSPCNPGGIYVALPDTNFGNWLYQNGYAAALTGNAPHGYYIDTTNSLVRAADTIICTHANIRNLTGIQYFHSLSYLDCSDNVLTTLGMMLPSTLQVLYCDSNQLDNIPALPAGVTSISCRYNQYLFCMPHIYVSQLNKFYITGTSITCVPDTFTAVSYDVNPVSLPQCGSNCNPTGFYVKIPDNNFGEWMNGNGFQTALTGNYTSGYYMDTTDWSVRSEANLYCFSANIHDLTGVQYFHGLNELDCENNVLTTLPLLPEGLQYINCYGNQMTRLPTLPSSVIYLDCSNNLIDSIPGPLPIAMTTFYCQFNRITNFNNVLSSNLAIMNCSDNPLDSLPPLPPSLYDLICNNDGLRSITALGPGFEALTCDSNNLTSLPYLPASLTNLECSYNPSLYCLPHIYDSDLGSFLIAGTGITCLPNSFSASYYDINPADLPICNASSGCFSSAYLIEGNVHNDTTGTCISDSLLPGSLIHNVKVLLKQYGQIVQQCYTTVDSGLYSFGVDSAGGYTVEIDTSYMPMTLACPSSDSFYLTLSATDTVALGLNFGVQCPGVDYAAGVLWSPGFVPADTSEIFLLAGNPLLYWYNAECGAAMSGTVITILNGPVQYAAPAPGALTPTYVSGDTILYTISDLDSLTVGSLYILATTDSSATIGTPVCVSIQIIPATPDIYPADDTMTQCYVVSSSFDPNHKSVSPVTLTPESEWLTYTIDFQNTGTNTAVNIVVKDTLSSNVDATTFQYLASSSPAKVKLNGNACTFTFSNINLPEKSVNPIGSEGWVQYRVKTLPNLPQTADVQNKAYIYFDLNSPILTNTVNTTYPSGINTVSNNTNTIHLYPNPNGGSFTLQTIYTYDTRYSIYDMLGDLVAQHSINSTHEQIDLPNAAAGVYTLIVRSGASSQALKFVVTR